MRILFIILGFLTVFGVRVQAQVQADCGTEIDSATFAQISSTIALRKSWMGHSRSQIQVPVQHFVFRTSGGSGGITSADIQDAMDDLNGHYQSASIQFYECSAVRFINSSTFYNYSQSQQSQLLATYYVNNVVNVYHFNSVTSNSGSSLCGYSDFPPGPDIVMMRGSCTLNGSTLSHEFGHYFSVLHTHSTIGGAEFVDGSNCSSAGDLLCDTPADPVIGNSNVNTSCVYTGTQLDPQGDLYAPDTRNIMSYSRRSCRNSFSPTQYSMLNYSAINDRDYLGCSSINLCTIPANQTEDSIGEDAADLVWTATFGNTYEVKYREPGSGWTVEPATSASLALIGLDCNTEYEWQVRSICVAGGASYWSASRFFNTLPCVVPCSNPTSAEEDVVGVDYAELDWVGPLGNDFEVRYRLLGGSWVADTASASTLTISGLICASEYEWQVRTLCLNGGISSWTAARTFDTDSCPPNFCNVPVNLLISNIQADRADVNWDNVNDAASYELQYRELGFAAWSATTVFGEVAALNNLNCGYSYEWQVRTVCTSGGISAWSPIQNFATDTCLCGNPTLPYAISPTNGSVQLNSVQFEWNFDDCIDYYEFELSHPNEPDFSSGALYSLSNYNINTLLLTNQVALTNNSNYYWRVGAYNSQGYSGPSLTYWFAYNPEIQSVTEASNLTYVGLYPNPSAGKVNLSIELLNRESISIYVYNLLGQQVYTSKLEQVVGNNNIEIDLQSFPSGTYLLRVATPSGSIARKFEVLH